MQDQFSAAFAEIEASVDRDGEDGFWRAQDTFTRIVIERLHVQKLNSLAAHFLSTRSLRGKTSTNGRFLVLASSRHVALAIINHSSLAKEHFYSPSHYYQAVVSGEVHVTRSLLPDDFQEAVFDSHLVLGNQTYYTYGVNDVFSKNGRREAVTCDPISDCTSYILRLSYGPLGDFEWSLTEKPVELQARMEWVLWRVMQQQSATCSHVPSPPSLLRRFRGSHRIDYIMFAGKPFRRLQQ